MTDEFALGIGQRISGHRKKLKMTQNTLAQKIGVTVTSVSMWETGRRIPNIRRLAMISDILDVPLDLLIPDLPHDVKESEDQMDIYDILEED